MFSNKKFGAAFAKAVAGGAAGAAAFASAAGVAGEGQQGHNTVSISSSSAGAGASVVVTGARQGGVGNVTIVAGKVWIDGTEIPEDATEYTAPSGRTYKIHRRDGRVDVTTE